ncbi:MAG TPA: double zinc ribbon domain-containing protein [Solirubrobacteraceae bacterium]|nr:double zinc ribbon domain-containing protein [Solirubrobacteraceae bacterium]
MLRRLADELLALLVPPACLACRRPLTRAGDPLCPTCRRALPWMREPRCPRCALPAPCRPCPGAGAPFDAAWAPVAHDGSARALVAALKFRGRLPVADLMAGQIAATAPPGLLASPAVLVPVPADPGRRRARGFDQAERLCRALASRTGLPRQAVLRRRGSTPRQVGSSRATRLAPGRLPVVATRPGPARAVLVDDVHTTGATLRACAAALRAAGTNRVACVTYARALRGG